MSMFSPATKKQLKARIALDGPAGSGKTYTALRLAFALSGSVPPKVAVIDTEHRSASKYIGESPDGFPWQFDVCELEHYSPSTYANVIKAAGAEGYDVLIVDSLSHAWEGVGGALDQVDKAKGNNSFTAWKDVTPQHRAMIDALLACPCHVIVTMRTKMEYVLTEKTNSAGKKVMAPEKIGMAPVQRAGMEYEFDVVCDLDVHHTMTVSKTRCSGLDGQKANKPGPAFVAPLKDWLNTGTVEEKPPGDLSVAGNTKSGGVSLSGSANVDGHSASLSDPCGNEVATEIKKLAQQAEVSPGKIVEILHGLGVERLNQLPLGDAQELKTRLERRIAESDTPF